MSYPPEATLVASAQRHLYPNYRQPELVMARGEGCQLWDTEGRRYLDLFAGIAVSTLGHAHPRLTRALCEQAGQLLHLSNYFYNEVGVRLAERLCTLSGLSRVFFCSSGTEANEALLKLARHHFYLAGQQQRSTIIAFHNSFHGRTLGALTATGQPKYREGFGPMSGVVHVPFGDLAAVEAALGPEVAGVLVEPVQGEGGVLPAPPGFLEGLRELTRAHGALLLVDEVQTGVGRTGKFLAVQHWGVVPDAVALAKGLGGGVPIGAMLTGEHLAEALPPGSHGTTFGGGPLAAAAAHAVLDALEAEELMARADRLGQHLHEALSRLVERFPQHAVTTRGMGLLRVLMLAPEVDARAVMSALREAGVLLTLAGGQGLRFSPPLVVSQAELDEGVAALTHVLQRL